MIDIITTIAKYLIIIMCLIYTLSCYTVFRPKNRDRKEDLLDNQVIYMFVFLFLCYTVLFLQDLFCGTSDLFRDYAVRISVIL